MMPSGVHAVHVSLRLTIGKSQADVGRLNLCMLRLWKDHVLALERPCPMQGAHAMKLLNSTGLPTDLREIAQNMKTKARWEQEKPSAAQ